MLHLSKMQKSWGFGLEKGKICVDLQKFQNFYRCLDELKLKVCFKFF